MGRKPAQQPRASPARAEASQCGESRSPVRISLRHTLRQLLACGRRNKILQPIKLRLQQESRVAKERTLPPAPRLIRHHPEATDPSNRARPKTQLGLSQLPEISPSLGFSSAAYRCTMMRTFMGLKPFNSHLSLSGLGLFVSLQIGQ